MSSVRSQSSPSPAALEFNVPSPASSTGPSAACDSAQASTAKRKAEYLKQIPPTRVQRDELNQCCLDYAATLKSPWALTHAEIESAARGLLDGAHASEGFLGWMMVELTSALWRPRVAATPFARRLLLLPEPPHNESCVHVEGTSATASTNGRRVVACAACDLATLRERAAALHYHIAPAADSPATFELLASGRVEAIIGVADLDLLEKALDKLPPSGIPCMAIALSHEGRRSTLDDDRALEMIELRTDDAPATSGGYPALMRSVATLFDPRRLEALIPRRRGRPGDDDATVDQRVAADPIAGTEAIAFDFLSRGGKHSRPFITLAVYDALTGGAGAAGDCAAWLAGLSPAILRTAMSIETFHKASLVHDDIEDDDHFRYGQPTVHRKYGVPTAINVGDYLIGLGYRLVGREAATLGPAVAAEILDRLAEAHLKLAEGQGAELLWRDSREKRLTPEDALKIYALKTSPAFEAALFSGLRLVGPVGAYEATVQAFAEHLGVAFQILNDLGDWRGDDHNKLLAAGDVTGGRPTVLWALALAGLNEAERARLLGLASGPIDAAVIERIRALYERADVFAGAERLVNEHRRRAEELADGIQPEPLARLFRFLIAAVLG